MATNTAFPEDYLQALHEGCAEARVALVQLAGDAARGSEGGDLAAHPGWEEEGADYGDGVDCGGGKMSVGCFIVGGF